MTSVHPAVERADALIDLERCEEARQLLGRRLAEDPQDVRAWVKLARSHLVGSKDPEKALEATETALGLAPGDIGALVMRAHALQAVGGRLPETEDVLRQVVRLAPEYWYGYALLADKLFRINIVRQGQANGGGVRAHEMADLLREPDELARTAIRLAPEEVYAYEVAWRIASLGPDKAAADRLDDAILRLDSQHPEALARRTKRSASAPGVRAATAATLYADALAVAPDSAAMQRGLDDASYRLLRGLRWPALFCLLFAAVGIDLFPVDGEVQRALPLPLGQRLWDLVPMAAIWVVSALLVYRRLRTGIQLNLRSVVRRRVWPRIVLVQAAWTMLCALLLVEVPWTDRTVPQVLFWVGLLSSVATMRFDWKRTD